MAMGLEEYSKKRDFEKTPEPEAKKAGREEHRFVVQKHQASHLHYDFRLEMEGVLRSWAVPKGLPAESGVRRLAVQTEDHPVEYLDFEGTIPKGEYGAGTVEIWDRGTFELDKEASDRLEFTLHGERLSGGYAMIHTGKDNWLLIKRKESA
jgi:DNA ligase D-like protein (predicted 3'-phosphoesterase)